MCTDAAAIIERLRAATGAGYELDLMIREWHLRPVIGGLLWPAFVASAGAPKPYTASLDAALTLVPEGLPRILGDKQTPETRPWARIGSPLNCQDTTGATLPLAVCIAALLARQAAEAGDA